MLYVSSRGGRQDANFADVLFDGMAPDGGLYLPQSWPKLDPALVSSFRGMEYSRIAAHVMAPYTENVLDFEELLDLTQQAYAGFDHQAVVPVTQASPDCFLMELFHGPTLAFKDLAMQFIGRLFEHMLAKRQRKATIIGATSGDTGAAAVEAFRGRANTNVVILYPKNRVSDVQRRQMTTAGERNVHVLAVEGNFDDCQHMVKQMFAQRSFADEVGLSGVNSINWARVMAQSVYYFSSAASLGGLQNPLRFVVPTGNFGDIFAGYVAHRMGLPMAGLVVATNANDILCRAFRDGEYRPAHVHETLSPAMDIQVSSNFERLIFDFVGRDGGKVAGLMQAIEQGGFTMPREFMDHPSRPLFEAHAADDMAITAAIGRFYAETGMVIDPHTATGLHAHHHIPKPDGVVDVCLACAHPAKFPEAVEAACGVSPSLPHHLARRMEEPEREHLVPADLGQAMALIRSLVA